MLSVDRNQVSEERVQQRNVVNFVMDIAILMTRENSGLKKRQLGSEKPCATKVLAIR
jgi:hypothetical protein